MQENQKFKVIPSSMVSLRQPEIHETGVVMPALRRQRHEDTCELKGNLVYKVSVRPELHSKTLSQKQKAGLERCLSG